MSKIIKYESTHSVVEHIIIQAGGRGSKLGYHTKNKPKALVSVNGEPLIIREMKLYPKAHFYVIADYKKEILEKYLKIYSSVSYTIIQSKGIGTCSGIKQCLKYIPDQKPILITWCDIYFEKQIYPKRIKINKSNHIGLSRTFPCRWKYENGKLAEERSAENGVSGVFIFKNKKQIQNVPASGEFCRYLQMQEIQFSTYYLTNAKEVGSIKAYDDAQSQFHHTRPFNSLEFKKDKVVKRPKDPQGRKLINFEINWYKTLEQHSFEFLPKIYTYHPLVMQKISGKTLFLSELAERQKIEILMEIVKNLKKIHTVSNSHKSYFKNDYYAILGKTKERLDEISSLIPDIKYNTIVINGKKCINFYKHWNITEKLLKRFFPQEYVYIHGDPTFSNIQLDNANKLYIIDPRGYYGKSLLWGDEDYDWAKVYYSLKGNYDQFNIKNFELHMDQENNQLLIHSNGWENLEEYFLKLIQRDPVKIRAYHAMIWLSLTTYSWDNYDSICGAFYNGIYLTQELYEKIF